MAETIPKLDSIARLSESAEVRFGVNWLINYLGSEHSCRQYPLLKFSPDFHTVRNEIDRAVPVKSAVGITSNVAYYEVTLVTDGPNRIGWCSDNSEFVLNNAEQVGDDEFSISLDGVNGCFWNEKNAYKIKNFRKWRSGDIVGCGIDLDNSKLLFTVNGKPIFKKRLSKFDFGASKAFFAAASVQCREQLVFNFGERPFEYSPMELNINSKNPFQSENRLLEPVLTNGSYWFKNKNPVEEFADYKQAAYCQWVTDLGLRIQVEDFDREFFHNDFRWQFEWLLKQKDGCVRMIYEIVRSLGKIVAEEKLNVVSSWLNHYLCFLDEQIGSDLIVQSQGNVAEMRYMDRIQFDSEGNTFRVPSLAKFLELLYPYMQIDATENENSCRLVRNTCIVLNILASKFQQIPDFINEELATFYLTILNKSSDSSSILYTLTALEYFQIDQELKQLLRPAVERIVELTKNDSENAITSEIHFAAVWCMDKVFGEIPLFFTKSALLDRVTATENMKLYQNQARSDFGWQTVRSQRPITGNGCFYYEVTVLTSGSMRIGWATDDCDFSDTIVGDDEFSVGIDLYRQTLFNYGDKFKLKNVGRMWRAGDVLGCLINLEQQKFSFYLNGEPIEMKKTFFKKIIFSNTSSYRPAATLSPFQQVKFNFGETPFKFTPATLSRMR